MRTKILLASLTVGLGLFSRTVTTAQAAALQPVPPVNGGTTLPPGQRCTVEALNVGGIVNANGTMLVPNVPARGQIRLRTTCTDALGGTTTGQSALTSVVAGGSVDVGAINFDAPVAVAARLTIAPLSLNLTSVGATQQLAVGATFANQSTGNVTAASTGTIYRSSNLAVAVVSPNGQVTALGPGTAIISALNEGAMGLATVTVRSASLTNLAITPASVTLSFNPAFSTAPAQLRVLGSLSDGKTIDLSSASSGILYSSSAPGIAAVSPDGSIVGVASGSATITVIDPQSGTTRQVPVTVSAFSPVPTGAYNTPGFAHNVDIDGSRIFVADGPGGLQIFNAFSATAIGKLSFINNQAVDVKVSGPLAAVALGNGGFALVDVSDPTKPKHLFTRSSIGYIRDLWVSGNRLYLASSTGLLVYDIGNPAAPTQVGSVAGFNATAVAGDSTRGVVVVLTSQPAVKVIQTSSWAQATLSLPSTTYQADDVTLFGTTAYVANGLNQLREVDITNPATPAFKSSSTLPQFTALGVAVRQTSQGLLVAAADNIFVNAVPLFNAQLNNTFNINCTQPVPPSYVPIRADADSQGVALGDGFGVVAVGSDGIQVFRTQQLTDNSGIAPTISVTEPTNSSGVFSGQLTTINATATDDVGVSLVEFLVGGNVVAVAGTAPFSGDFVPGASCTTQVIKARATDTSGNTADSLPVSIKVLCADGQPCSTNADCANNACTGGVCNAPCGGVYASCKALQVACPTSASGTRTLDPDGSGPQLPFQAYCEMGLGGGGWTLVSKMSNQDTKHWVNAKISWTSATTYGSTTSLSAGQDAKSPAWGTVPASDFLLTDDVSYAGGKYVTTTSSCVGNATMSQFFTTALANYPTFSGQTWYKECPTFNNYIPAWTYEPNFLFQDPSSPSNSLNQGYLTIAKTEDVNASGVISFYPHTSLFIGPDYQTDSEAFGAAVGLAGSQIAGTAFGTIDEFQDIGGPLSCDLVDATCKMDYPQTVFMFVR